MRLVASADEDSRRHRPDWSLQEPAQTQDPVPRATEALGPREVTTMAEEAPAGTPVEDTPAETPAEDVQAEAPVEEALPPLVARLAELVRERSRTTAKLTPLDKVQAGDSFLDEEQKAHLIEEILAGEDYRDLRVLRTSAGATYLYCTTHISDSYARLLFRVAEGNPYELIASTVREESETYPRPTTAILFKEPPFLLDQQQVEGLAREMAQLEQYRDVKPIRATTGALYLYSDRFLDAEWARSLVEYEEVGRFNNP